MNVSGAGNSALFDQPLAAVKLSNVASLTITSSSSTTTTISDSINLSADYIQSVDNSMGNAPDPSNADSLFTVLNANILAYPNLGGVGSAIDTYTKSLASSTVYDSSYTAPSAKFLADLANLKTAAASGNLVASQSDLATAEGDAPDNVAGGMGTAVSVGDTAGEASLMVEGTANMSRYLATQGYTPTGAEAEAIALTLNGLSEYATNTPSSSAQTRLQQISDLAMYATENGGTTQAGATPNASDPLFNIISTLLDSQSGNAIDQSLTNLEALYKGGTSAIVESNTSIVQTTTLIEYLNTDQENASSSSSAPSSSTETRFHQISGLATPSKGTIQAGATSSATGSLFGIISTLLDPKSGTSADPSLAILEALYKSGTSVILESSTSTIQTSLIEYFNRDLGVNQDSASSTVDVKA